MRQPTSRTLMVVLGSGGHTTEMLYLLDSLDLPQLGHHLYVVSDGDIFSANRAIEWEGQASHSNSGRTHSLRTVSRARQVHQSWLTTPWTALQCVRDSAMVIRKNSPDVVLLNGPGTVVCIILAMYLLLLFGLIPRKPRTIYVESFARVRELSLSGRILYALVDRCIVQWKPLLQAYPRAEFRRVLIPESREP